MKKSLIISMMALLFTPALLCAQEPQAVTQAGDTLTKKHKANSGNLNWEPIVFEIESTFSKERSETQRYSDSYINRASSDHEDYKRNRDYSYTVTEESLFTTTNKCSAVLLSKNWLLTHRSCLEKAGSFETDIIVKYHEDFAYDVDISYYLEKMTLYTSSREGMVKRKVNVNIEGVKKYTDATSGLVLLNVGDLCLEEKTPSRTYVCARFIEWMRSSPAKLAIHDDYSIAVLGNMDNPAAFDKKHQSFTGRTFFVPEKDSVSVKGIEGRKLTTSYKASLPGTPLFFRGNNGNVLIAVHTEEGKSVVFNTLGKTFNEAAKATDIKLSDDIKLLVPAQ